MSQGKSHILLLDLLYDEAARPVFIYAVANILFGTILYSWLEGWNWLDSLYFVVITLATIGYGDITPTKPITKLITIIFAINGIAILLMLYDEIRRLRDPAKTWQKIKDRSSRRRSDD